MDHLDEMLSSLDICNSSSSVSASSSPCSSSSFITSSILNVSNYEDKDGREGLSRYKVDPVNLVGKIGAVIICFLIITGVVGNLLVLTVIIKTRHLRRSYNFLIASLSVTDLIFNVFIMPFYVDSYLYRRWRFTDDLCRFETYFGTMTVMTSAFHIGLIAANRSFLIVLPGWYPVVSSGRALIFQVGLAWMMALAVVLPGALGWNAVVRYSDQIGRCSYLRSESRMSLFLVFNFGFICPCAIMCFCYFMIWNVTRQSRRKLENHTQRPTNRTPPLAVPCSGQGQSSAGVVKSSTSDYQVGDASRRNLTESTQSSNEIQPMGCHGDEKTRSAQMLEELQRSEETVPTEEDAQEVEDERLLSSLALQEPISKDDAYRLLMVKTLPAPPSSTPLPKPPAAATEELISKRCPYPEKTQSTTVIDPLRLSAAAAASNSETSSITLSSLVADEPDPPLMHSCATDNPSASEACLDFITDTPRLLSNEPFGLKSVDEERLLKTDLAFREDIQLMPVARPFIQLSQTKLDKAKTDKSEPLLHICVPDSPTQTEEKEEEDGEVFDREEEEEEGEKEEESVMSCTGGETVIKVGHDTADQRNKHFAAPVGIHSDVGLNRKIAENCFERSEEPRVFADERRHADHQSVRLLQRLLRFHIHNTNGAMTKQEQFQVHSGNFSRAPDGKHIQCAMSSGTTPELCRNGKLTGSFENPSPVPMYSLALGSQMSLGDGDRFASGPIRSSNVQDGFLLPDESVNAVAYNAECTICPGICQQVTNNIPKSMKRNDDHGKNTCRQVTRSNQRSVKMILVIFVAFLLTYLPFTIMNLADEHSVLDRNWYMITSLGFWSGSCVNPLIYGIMNRQFRAAYGSIFLSCRKAILNK